MPDVNGFHKGVAFINFTSEEYAAECLREMRGFRNWGMKCEHSREHWGMKGCGTKYADVQGYAANLEHSATSRTLFKGRQDHEQPIFFDVDGNRRPFDVVRDEWRSSMRTVAVGNASEVSTTDWHPWVAAQNCEELQRGAWSGAGAASWCAHDLAIWHEPHFGLQWPWFIGPHAVPYPDVDGYGTPYGGHAAYVYHSNYLDDETGADAGAELPETDLGTGLESGVVDADTAEAPREHDDGGEVGENEDGDGDEDEDEDEDDAEHNTQEDEDEDGDGAAVYCEDCEKWLNGPTQWEDHKIGKKHKKKLENDENLKKDKKLKKDENLNTYQQSDGWTNWQTDGWEKRDDESITAWAPCAAKASYESAPADGWTNWQTNGWNANNEAIAWHEWDESRPAGRETHGDESTTAWWLYAANESSESALPLPVAAEPTSPPLMLPNVYACLSCDAGFVKWTVCLNHVKTTIACKHGPDGRDLLLDPDLLRADCKEHAAKLFAYQ